MPINLSDYRFLLDGVLEAYPDTPPNPSIWRYMLEWWPDSLRKLWGEHAAKHEDSGLSWQDAEWLAFKFFVIDTKRHDLKNPDRKIKWEYPKTINSPSLDENNTILADENFIFNFQHGVTYNSNLGLSAKEQLDELDIKLKETEDDVKDKLALQKETTVKKRSSVKREPKQVKETKIKASKEERPSKRKSKFDSGMGALFS